MTTPDGPRLVTGPLKTWYDMHEALGHEVRGLADDAAGLTGDGLDAFVRRFGAFDAELRNHSEVEDAIMFPAVVAAGGTVPDDLFGQHRDEQLVVYELGTAVMAARGRPDDPTALAALAPAAVALRDSLLAHLEHEEEAVLGQVDGLFDPDRQAALLRSIIGAMPADPGLQPWVAGALTPEHLEARLRNMASSLGQGALVGVMTQIRDGVDAATWVEVQRRTPDLAELATT